jgi:hypothetical protein
MPGAVPRIQGLWIVPGTNKGCVWCRVPSRWVEGPHHSMPRGCDGSPETGQRGTVAVQRPGMGTASDCSAEGVIILLYQYCVDYLPRWGQVGAQ